MSLIRQVWLLLLATVLLAFVGSVGVATTSARDLLQTQLLQKNSDNAASLALRLEGRGVAVVGAILGAYGYIQSRGPNVVQPESALWAIRLIMSFIPTAITLIGMVALWFYDLDEQKLAATTSPA